MTPQEIFDRVATHLLTQGRKALSKAAECMYRAPDGCKCAVGCLISDEDYSPIMEAKPANTLSECGLLPLHLIGHESLLMSLQMIHDGGAVRSWPKSLRNVAEFRKLSTAVLDNFPDWKPKDASDA